MTQTPAAGRRWGRRFGVLLAVVAAIAVLAAAALATGLPQRAILRAALGAVFEGPVEVGRVSTLGALRVARVAVGDPQDVHGPPAILLEDFVIDYRLWPGGGRHVHEVTLGRLDVDVEKAQRIVKPGKSRSTPNSNARLERLLPERFKIGSLTVRSTTPSYGFDVRGLSFDAEVEGPDAFVAVLSGGDVGMSLWTRSGGFSREVSGGHVNMVVKREGRTLTVSPLEANLPGLLTVGGSLSSIGREIGLELQRFVAEDIDFTKADHADLSVPFGFKRLDLSGTRVKGPFDFSAFSAQVPDTFVRVAADELVAGPQGAEYYKGDLSAEVRGVPGNQADYTVTATLNRGQTLTGSLKGHYMAMTGRAALQGWSREDILAALPVSAQGDISNLPLLTNVDSATIDFDWKMPAVTVNGAVAAVFEAGGEKRPASVTFKAQGPLMPTEQRRLDVTGEVGLAGGTLGADGTLTAQSAAWKLRLDNVDPDLWLTTLNDRDMLKALDTRLSGTVELEQATGSQQIMANVDLAGSPFAYGSVGIAEGKSLSIQGPIKVDLSAFGTASGPQLGLRVDDENYVVLRDWEMPVANFALTGQVESKIDLAMIEPMLPGSDLRGDISLQGPLRNERGYTNLEFSGTIDGLGYKDYAAPYGVPIETSGTFSFDNLNGRLTGHKFLFRLPKSTSLESDGWTLGGGAFAAPFTFKTDFTPLVAMGLLDGVEGGSGTATGILSQSAGGPKVEMSIDARAGTLVVGGARAALTGPKLKATLSNGTDGLFRGEGTLSSEKMALLGTIFEDIEGPVSLDGDFLRAKGLRGTTYGGAVSVDLEAGLFAENLPVRMQLSASKVNLELFTRTLEVPTVQMTGLADGEALLVMNYPGGIKDFEANLRSSENFSVSTVLLERLLALQFARQYAGKKQMERVRAQILGKEELRAFDSGRLVLNYEGERIGGQAELKSGGLDLTVDLQMDTEAFFSALRIAQEARVEGLGVKTR